MTRRLATRRTGGLEPRPPMGDSPNDSLDAIVDEAMERFVRVLIRRGVSERSVRRSFRRAWLCVPQDAAERNRRASRELVDVCHVLTLWFGDPLYVDTKGDPLSLPLRGPAPSLASLVQHVDPTLNVTQVLKCLIGADAVRRRGSRYSPRSRAVAFRGTGAPLHARNLRALLGLLRTLEHNLGPKDKGPAWFEYVAENPRFPASAREPFDARLRQDAMTFLCNQDSQMLNHERKAKSGESTVRMGVGVFRFEEETLRESPAVRRTRRRRLKSNRKKRRGR